MYKMSTALKANKLQDSLLKSRLGTPSVYNIYTFSDCFEKKKTMACTYIVHRKQKRLAVIITLYMYSLKIYSVCPGLSKRAVTEPPGELSYRFYKI